ncbi:MAG: type II toxin-antitoxin system VapC family toxin [Gallionellaceae bacterium]|nr:type II toxin-antitoxin system VapC family toxin [Gallionellaceae bacterium]
MHYLDTCFITPMLLNEATSEAVERYVVRAAAGSLCISQWTRVEFASVVAREVRMKKMKASQGTSVLAEFDKLVQESLLVLVPMAEDYNLAHDYLGKFSTGLRGGDALHLAIAVNHGASKILSLDKGLLSAGKQLKLPVSRGIKI